MKITVINESDIPAIFEHGVNQPIVIEAGESIRVDITPVSPLIIRAPQNSDELEAAAKAKLKDDKKSKAKAKAEEEAIAKAELETMALGEQAAEQQQIE